MMKAGFFRGQADLVPVARARSSGRSRRNPPAKDGGASGDQSLDFELPTRAFVKKYAARRMSGAKRFVLLLASLTKGKAAVDVPFQDIKRSWDKMTEPMGGKFNPAHTTRAKDNGWIDTPKT